MKKENTTKINKKTPAAKYPNLKGKFEILKKLEQEHIKVGKRMLSAAGGKMLVLDLAIVGFLKRSIDLIDGIITLINSWNIIGAAPLVRLQLDNLLRLYYLSTLKNSDDIALEILKGRSFLDMEDSEGKKITDARLRYYARSQYPWLDKVYEETSKFIHFSDKHYFLTVNSFKEQTGSFELFIGKGAINWPESELNTFLDAVICITDAILKLIIGWAITKQLHFDKL